MTTITKPVFDSDAIYDEASLGVKFAGRYFDGRGLERYVICRVSREGLIDRCKLADPTPKQLLDAYASIREVVQQLAVEHFVAGDPKPFISADDLAR